MSNSMSLLPQLKEQIEPVSPITRIWTLFGNILSLFQILWLFTYSDLKTMVIPSTTFAISTSMAKAISHSEAHIQLHVNTLLLRIPSILLWTWLNCLAFNINNQKSPAAIQEDSLNKPWRPIPSHRLNKAHILIMSRASYPIAILASCCLKGGLTQSLLLALFGYMYNDLRLGDKNVFSRNLLNSWGFTSFAAGALSVAEQSSLDAASLRWLTVIGLVVFTTVHIQDLYDQVGDAAVNRQTIPLVLGDRAARWSIAVLILLWSYVCPIYLATGVVGYGVLGALGVIVAGRLALCRSVDDDKRTFVVYNVWLMAIYVLPLLPPFSSYIDSGFLLKSRV